MSLTTSGAATEHFFTVDVEEYFHVTAFENVLDRAAWERQPSRVERSVDQLLDLLARYGATGTFFTLGWIGRSHPHVVRRIAEAGHEIASHGDTHRRVFTMTRAEFAEELRRSKAVLEDVTGRRVDGFRAPSFSIRPGDEWAFDVLLEEGYRYDSSLFPIRRPDYGYPAAPLTPHYVERAAGAILELPMATTRLCGVRLPAAGGGYLRQLPYGLIRRAFREHDRRGMPGMFYIHPWELDEEQPRLPVGLVTRMRHYGGLARTMPRLERLLREFRFTSVARRFPPSAESTGRGPGALALPA